MRLAGHREHQFTETLGVGAITGQNIGDNCGPCPSRSCPPCPAIPVVGLNTVVMVRSTRGAVEQNHD